MHTNFLNIQSPKEKMHKCMVEKTASNTETTIGLHQQVQLLVMNYSTGQTWQSQTHIYSNRSEWCRGLGTA